MSKVCLPCVCWLGFVLCTTSLSGCKKSEPATVQEQARTERVVPLKGEGGSDVAAQPTSITTVELDSVEKRAVEAATEALVDNTVNGQVQTEANGANGLPRQAPRRSRAGAAEAVEVVTDPLLINVGKGALRPQVGDKIYTERNLPLDACGTYWVRDDSGLVEEMSVCRDEH